MGDKDTMTEFDKCFDTGEHRVLLGQMKRVFLHPGLGRGSRVREGFLEEVTSESGRGVGKATRSHEGARRAETRATG